MRRYSTFSEIIEIYVKPLNESHKKRPIIIVFPVFQFSPNCFGKIV